MGAFSFDAGVLGKTERFDEVLRLLQSSGYTEEFICRRCRLERAEEFGLDRRKRSPLPRPESAADILLQVFLAGETLKPDPVSALLGDNNAALLEAMGLLKLTDSGDFYSPVSLYPVDELYIASDRWTNPDGSRLAGPEDTVYPAFIPNTRLFLKHVPQQGTRFLDLCAGTGVAALLAARRGAAESWSGDIAERSTKFAEFNRRLNGIPNARMVTSDLFQNLEGLRFDAIVAHPPYVPTLKPKWIFASGGSDGEEITRNIISGLPAHLEDGGRFMALTMGSDRAGRPLEHRIREWLGALHTEFDIAVIVRKELDPQTFALRANRDTIHTREESEQWDQLFTALQIQSLVYGFICIQRRTGARRTFTIRRQSPPGTLRSPWEWLLRWEAAARQDELPRIILESPLYASGGTDFRVQHRLQGNAWNPVAYTLSTDHPFSTECDAQPWMAHLISACNGHATGIEIFKILIENDALPPNTQPDAFASAAASLVSAGFIEVAGFRPASY